MLAYVLLRVVGTKRDHLLSLFTMQIPFNSRTNVSSSPPLVRSLRYIFFPFVLSIYALHPSFSSFPSLLHFGTRMRCPDSRTIF